MVFDKPSRKNPVGKTIQKEQAPGLRRNAGG
jgi:hypothetical protein